jgi:hypothetical protein
MSGQSVVGKVVDETAEVCKGEKAGKADEGEEVSVR